MSKLSAMAQRLDADVAHWCGDPKVADACQEAAALLRKAEALRRNIDEIKRQVKRLEERTA